MGTMNAIGLDPAIHRLVKMMDARIKSGHDGFA